MSAVVEVADLVKTYPAKRKAPAVEAVRGVSFAVEPGEFFGLLGPNGAGKSTTLGCITTLVRPTVRPHRGGRARRGPAAHRSQAAAGRGAPDAQPRPRPHRARGAHLPRRAISGCRAREREARADRLLAQMQLTDKAGAKPLTLSGGLQQRLLIARALMHDPKVLLLDEPTIGLDPQARRLLWDLLQGLHRQGLTVIMTTHYMEEADRLCQRLAIIDHGKILTLDTPAALKQALPGRPGARPAGCARRSRWPRACRRCRASRASRRCERNGDATTGSSACVCSWSRRRPARPRAARGAGGRRGSAPRQPDRAEPGGRLHPPHGQGAAGMTAFLALLRRDLLVASRNALPLLTGHAHPADDGHAGVRQHPAAARTWWPPISAR